MLNLIIPVDYGDNNRRCICKHEAAASKLFMEEIIFSSGFFVSLNNVPASAACGVMVRSVAGRSPPRHCFALRAVHGG
jgi:hypothetical protein